MRTLAEILTTPVLLLTLEEIGKLEPKDQQWALNCQAKRAREDACPKHERIGISTATGWHSGHCKHCGKDMSYDSGD